MSLKIPVPQSINPVLAFGVHDSHLRLVERMLKVKLTPGEHNLIIEGDDESVAKTSYVLNRLFQLAQGNIPITHEDVRILIEKSETPSHYAGDNALKEGMVISGRRRGKEFRVKPRNLNQQEYVKKMLSHDLVFSVGPAGTGKTYLAVAVGLHLLTKGMFSRLILTRPVIEAGENLGFLPGTLEEKIDPYVRPLYDAIHDMLPGDETRYLIEDGVIELAPLAYMRGRTLANSFVILDEAQNTTSLQMKMFLTRLGENSKMVITGDVSQIDLPVGRQSGLREAESYFKDVEGIAFHYFNRNDVVRHGLVKKIIEIYENHDKKENI
ncbi:MAG: hypothetical protein A2Y33_11610 [Spirochaetes bacterium GWF1_51_8]|nr:MAG: hypothetical protein A2Y33_11610 [Spirochaetes bacterium GWF1_51_8]